jgi:hypothetical protein
VLAQLQEALESAGIVPFPPPTDPFLKTTDRSCMLDAKHLLDMLASERELLALYDLR